MNENENDDDDIDLETALWLRKEERRKKRLKERNKQREQKQKQQEQRVCCSEDGNDKKNKSSLLAVAVEKDKKRTTRRTTESSDGWISTKNHNVVTKSNNKKETSSTIHSHDDKQMTLLSSSTLSPTKYSSQQQQQQQEKKSSSLSSSSPSSPTKSIITTTTPSPNNNNNKSSSFRSYRNKELQKLLQIETPSPARNNNNDNNNTKHNTPTSSSSSNKESKSTSSPPSSSAGIRQRRRRIFIHSSNDSDDDSDDEDLVALSKKLQQQKKQAINAASSLLSPHQQQQDKQLEKGGNDINNNCRKHTTMPHDENNGNNFDDDDVNDGNKEEENNTTTTLPTPTPRRRRRQQRRRKYSSDDSINSSDDSNNDDDTDDLVSFARQLELEKKVVGSCNNTNGAGISNNSSNVNQQQSSLSSQKKTKNHKNKDYYYGSSSDSDNDNDNNNKRSSCSARLNKTNNNTIDHHSVKPTSRKVNDSLWNDYDDDDDEDNSNSDNNNNNKLIQNKGTFIRVEDLIVKNKTKQKEDDESSLFMDDDDEDDKGQFIRVEDMILNKKKKKKGCLSSSITAKKATTSRQSKKKQENTSSSITSSKTTSSPSKASSPKKRTKKRKKTNIDSDTESVSSSSSSSTSDYDDHDENDAANELKPNIVNPRWISDLVPLHLGTDDDDNDDDELVTKFEISSSSYSVAAAAAGKAKTIKDTTYYYQVPASINRYLKDYQREGIQFMYNGISKKNGIILGHDMGMGKTIQVIALLAALLNKTGTKIDLLNIKKITKFIQEKEKKHQRNIEYTLLHGTTKITNGNDNDATSSGNNDNDANATTINEMIKNNKRYTPILIIVPSSVISNWNNEFNIWGYFSVAIYHGKDRSLELEKMRNGTCEVLIIGKTLFSSESSNDYELINTISWKLCIVDEYHEYKNDKSKAYKHLRDLNISTNVKTKDDINHNRRKYCPIIGLTGTVMQNEHRELFNLVNLVQPNFLGDWKGFENKVSKVVKYGRTKDAKEDLIQKSQEQISKLLIKLKPVLLIKKKDDVTELNESLPMKDEKVVFCELSSIQKTLYQHILNLPDFQLLRLANAPCDCGVNRDFFTQYKKLKTKKEKMDFQRRHHSELTRRKECCYQIPLNPRKDEEGQPLIDPKAVLWKSFHPNNRQCNPRSGAGCPFCLLLPALNKLYQVCSHAALIQVDRDPNNMQKGSKERIEAEKQLDFAKVAVPKGLLRSLPGASYTRQDGIMDDHKMLSGKMEALDKLLRACERRDDRILLFSYSTTMLDLIQHYIKAEGHTFLRLDGTTPTMQRQELIDEFQNNKDIFIFLISTRAGGLGLNLTAANVVIVFDVNWNPSYDEQAQDRAYRIGQSRDVQVIRLVARGTIEEQKYIRQVYKVQLKQETLGKAGKEKGSSARIFRGVAGDKNRKGELFGSENLLKYKDGSFMADMWKAADSRLSKKLGGVEIHRTEDLSNAISNMSVEEVECIGSNNGHFDEDIDKVASGANGIKTDGKLRSPESVASNHHDDLPINSNAMNHEDFLRGGRAAVQVGDDGFEEEMGGLSQVVYNAMEMAPDAVESDDDYQEPTNNGSEPKVVVRKSSRTNNDKAEEGTQYASNKSGKEERKNVERATTKQRLVLSPIPEGHGGTLEQCKVASKAEKQQQQQRGEKSSGHRRRRRHNADVKLMGVSTKKMKTSQIKSKFTAADIFGKGLD